MANVDQWIFPSAVSDYRRVTFEVDPRHEHVSAMSKKMMHAFRGFFARFTHIEHVHVCYA